MDNVQYNTMKLLHELSCLEWFIKMHAKKDAQNAGNAQITATLEHLEKDLAQHINELHKNLCK